MANKKKIYKRLTRSEAIVRKISRKEAYKTQTEKARKQLAINRAKRAILIDTSGKLNPNWQQVLKNANLDDITTFELDQVLTTYGNNIETDVTERLKHYKKKGLTLTGLSSIIYSDYITNTLYNMDLNPEEVAQRIGVTLDELADPNNWNREIRNGKPTPRAGDTFTNPHNGMRWKFVFDYNLGSYYYPL